VKWKTKDGRVLKISEMETAHIENTIAMLERNGFCTPDDFWSAVSGASSLNGEYAQDAADEQIAGLKPVAILEHLYGELSARRFIESRLSQNVAETK